MGRRAGNVTSLSGRQRMLSLGLGVALNAAALTLLLALHSRQPERIKDTGSSLITVEAHAVPAAVTPPPIALLKIAAMGSLPDLSPTPTTQTSPAEVFGDSCEILGTVGKAIVDDPAAVDAIVHAPAETRSIADAIVIWNMGWSAAAQETGAPLEPVRANVLATLHAVPEDCLSSTVSGPRLVPVPNGDRTVFLVFGSGDWSWKSLMDPASIEMVDEMAGLG